MTTRTVAALAALVGAVLVLGISFALGENTENTTAQAPHELAPSAGARPATTLPPRQMDAAETKRAEAIAAVLRTQDAVWAPTISKVGYDAAASRATVVTDMTCTPVGVHQIAAAIFADQLDTGYVTVVDARGDESWLDRSMVLTKA